LAKYIELRMQGERAEEFERAAYLAKILQTPEISPHLERVIKSGNLTENQGSIIFEAASLLDEPLPYPAPSANPQEDRDNAAAAAGPPASASSSSEPEQEAHVPVLGRQVEEKGSPSSSENPQESGNAVAAPQYEVARPTVFEAADLG